MSIAACASVHVISPDLARSNLSCIGGFESHPRRL